MAEPILEIANFNLKLSLPNHALFVGASMSGKTRLVLHLLRRAGECLEPVPRVVNLYYDQHQKEYEAVRVELAAKGIEMHLRQGGGDLRLEDLEEHPYQTLVIIDDASEETASSQDIARITTNARHKNQSLWLIWHSLFSKHAASRIIAQNSAYLFLLPSPRLASQIHSLDSQLRYGGSLSAAYEAAMEEEGEEDVSDHRYLLLDLSANTPGALRPRSRVNNPQVQTAYLRRRN